MPEVSRNNDMLTAPVFITPDTPYEVFVHFLMIIMESYSRNATQRTLPNIVCPDVIAVHHLKGNISTKVKYLIVVTRSKHLGK